MVSRRSIVIALGALAGLVCAWVRGTGGAQDAGALAFFYWLQHPVFYLHWVIIGVLFGLGLAALWRLGRGA